MNEMIERVARAIAEADIGEPSYDRMARAAIEAMREPTMSMVLVGYDQLDGEYTPLAVENAWCAMIQEALNVSL